MEKKLSSLRVAEGVKSILSKIDDIDSDIRQFPGKVATQFKNSWIKDVNEFISQTRTLKSFWQQTGRKKKPPNFKNLRQRLEKIVDAYFSNLNLLINANVAENYLLQFNSLVTSELNEIISTSEKFMSAELYDKTDTLIRALHEMIESGKQKDINHETLIPASELFRKKINALNNVSAKKINPKRTNRLFSFKNR